MNTKIEQMTYAEYKTLTVDYSIYSTPIKEDVVIASTSKGVCYLGFCTDVNDASKLLGERFPHAVLRHQGSKFQSDALKVIFSGDVDDTELCFHLYGTPFQLKVWRALLNIPSGCLVSYGKVSSMVGAPKACRAVGSAVGSNPVAYLIPCHRVIRADGMLGNYHWGSELKRRIIEWERLAL